MQDDRFFELSKEMTKIGDKWRNVSSKAAQTCKGRSSDPDGYNTVANLLLEIADDEERFFIELKKLIK